MLSNFLPPGVALVDSNNSGPELADEGFELATWQVKNAVRSLVGFFQLPSRTEDVRDSFQKQAAS